MQIRKIHPDDNTAVRDIIQQTILEHNAPKEGTAYSDAATQSMYLEYQKPRSVYYVVEVDGKVCGGAGVAALANNADNICELQKMYFLKEARGKALGEKMIDHCLNYAKEQGFEMCYLETLPYMKAAQKLYLKKGFEYIDGPMGSTGHTSCNVWLTKKL